MKTKFLMILAAVVMMSGAVCAQEKKQKPSPEQMIEKRVERMQKRLMLDDAAATKFAPIYKEYLQACFAARPTCKKCDNPTDAQIKEMMEQRIEAKQKTLDIEKKYFKKLSSVLSGRQLQVVFGKDGKASFAKHKKDFKGKDKGSKKGQRCDKKMNYCSDKAPKNCSADKDSSPVAPVK